MSDYYNILGVALDAPPGQIRRAFREAAKAVHPDAHPGLPPQEREALNRRFILLAQAYETLGDPHKRAEYDRTLKQQARRAPPSGAHARSKQQERPRHRQGSPRTAAGAGGEAPPDETLDDLLRDVDDLLGRFGLDLRQPFDQLLEILLEWAKELFRQVTGPLDEPEKAPPHAAGPNAPHAKKRQGTPHRAKGPSGPRRQTPPSGAPPDLDAELANLKRHAQRKQSGPGAAKRAEDDVDAELTRLKRKKGK